MNAGRRAHYLKALGIETWGLRAADKSELAVDASIDAPSPPAQEAAPTSSRLRATPSPQPQATESSLLAAATRAPEVELPQDWDGLRAVVSGCQLCKLCTTRTQTVFGVGVTSAPLMVIGEGPGADEDAQGEPFVGRAGKLLDEMLKAIGRSRGENTYIANVVKCRPPGNRDPEADEVDACRGYLDQQIRLLKPKLIVAVGRVAAQRLLQTDQSLARLRGPMHRYGPDNTPVFITYHPAYLLRSPREKAKSWDDLKKVHRFLAG